MFAKKKAMKNFARVILMGLVCGSVLGIASGAWAEEYTEPQVVNGGSLVLNGDNSISINKSTSEKVVALFVNNGGQVTNGESDTLSVVNTNDGDRADGIVLWNDNSVNPPTSVTLYGLTGITAKGMDAHGVDVWENSVAKIVGDGEADIVVMASKERGQAYGVQVGDTGPASATIEGFKSISAYSQNGYARTLNIVGGSIVVNGVEAISAYGGLDPVDPDDVGQYGLAYAVQGAGGNIDINGNNTVITAKTMGSNTVGIGAGWNSVVRANGIKSIMTMQESGTLGQYSYAAGIEADGKNGNQSALYLNKETGSPYADISVTAPNTTIYGINAVNGGILQANLKDVTFSGLTVYGLYSTGKLDVCISGNLSAMATGSVYGIISNSVDSVVAVTGTGKNDVSVTVSGSDNVYGVYTTGGMVTLKDIGSMTISSDSYSAEAVYVEGAGSVVIDGITDIKVVSPGKTIMGLLSRPKLKNF